MNQKSETKSCQNCKNDFTIEPEDFVFYDKMAVPAPTFCPQCRFQRRLAHRNDRSLYRRECGLCNKKILSIYHKDSVIKNVFCPECWWGDGWDPFNYGVDYDFSKDFFTQYFEFKKNSPHQSVYHVNFVNSEYCNFGHSYKNCYLVFGGYNNENVSYGNLIGDIMDSSDVSLSTNLEMCYEVNNCFHSSKLRFCNSCEDSSDLTFCTDCRGCVSCFGCAGLRNKQYNIFNQQYSKAEYEEKLKDLNISSFKNKIEIENYFKNFALQYPYRYTRTRNVVDCTGDDITNSKNCKDGVWGHGMEDSRYVFFTVNAKECYDITAVGTLTGGTELLYEVSSSFGGHRQMVGIRTVGDRNSFYSEDCHNCNDIFGCIGLKKKSYCIFNKQYSKEEYEELLPKIIEQMKAMTYTDKMGRVYGFGEFWPIELSPFGYNETKAMEYFILNKNGVLDKRFNWYEKEVNTYEVTMQNINIPDDSSNVDESILNEIIECAHSECNHGCTKAFKINPNEFQVIKQLGAPLPRACPNCRHYERLDKQQPIQFWQRSCMCELTNHEHEGKCQVEFQTTYSPDRPEKVYCEKCYQQEVV